MRVGGTGSKAHIPMAGSLTVLQGYTQPREDGRAEAPPTPYLAVDPGSSDRPPFHPEMPLPKRNYGFEKRQKELAKKRKREEKRQRRAERNATDDPTAPDPDEDPDSPDSPDTPTAQP